MLLLLKMLVHAWPEQRQPHQFFSNAFLLSAEFGTFKLNSQKDLKLTYNVHWHWHWHWQHAPH